MAEDSNSEGGKSTPWPPPGADGPPVIKLTSPVIHNGNKRQAARIRKEEYRTKRELKAKLRKEKATLKEKKRKEQEDTLLLGRPEDPLNCYLTNLLLLLADNEN